MSLCHGTYFEPSSSKRFFFFCNTGWEVKSFSGEERLLIPGLAPSLVSIAEARVSEDGTANYSPDAGKSISGTTSLRQMDGATQTSVTSWLAAHWAQCCVSHSPATRGFLPGQAPHPHSPPLLLLPSSVITFQPVKLNVGVSIPTSPSPTNITHVADTAACYIYICVSACVCVFWETATYDR